MTPAGPVKPSSAIRKIARRLVMVAVGTAQLVAIWAAYDNNHRQFGFQMFPEASRWKAEIVRVEADGTRVSVNDDWEYRWSELVRGRGLGNPFVWHHADSGLRGQLDFFEKSLDWVATHTPDDTTTRYLEAEVTFLDNGVGPSSVTFRSEDRGAG